MTGKFKLHDQHLIRLKSDCDNFAKDFVQLDFKHVYRKNNELADDLCQKAMKKAKLEN